VEEIAERISKIESAGSNHLGLSQDIIARVNEIR
jgi:hypothetical protein